MQAQPIVKVPQRNVCSYKTHRFITPGNYFTVPMDARGRKSSKVQTTFIVQHCKCQSCNAIRLVK